MTFGYVLLEIYATPLRTIKSINFNPNRVLRTRVHNLVILNLS